MKGTSRALSPGILKFLDKQQLGRIFASTPCSHSKWHGIFVLQFKNCFFLLSIYSVLQYKGKQMLYELGSTCTASARLGTGKTLKKSRDADLRVLQAAFYKKKKKKQPTNNGRCLTTQHPHTHLQPGICKERQIWEAMHLNLTSNSNSVTQLRSMQPRLNRAAQRQNEHLAEWEPARHSREERECAPTHSQPPPSPPPPAFPPA